MDQEPKKQEPEELTEEDLDGVSGGIGTFEPSTILPRTIVPVKVPTTTTTVPITTPKLPSTSGS